MNTLYDIPNDPEWRPEWLVRMERAARLAEEERAAARSREMRTYPTNQQMRQAVIEELNAGQYVPGWLRERVGL